MMKTSFIVFVSNAAWSARSMGWDWTARHAYPRLRNIVCTALSDHVLCFASSPSKRALRFNDVARFATFDWQNTRFAELRSIATRSALPRDGVDSRNEHHHRGNIIKSSHAPTISLRNRRNTRKIFAPQTRADQRWCKCLRKRNEGVKTQIFSI